MAPFKKSLTCCAVNEKAACTMSPSKPDSANQCGSAAKSNCRTGNRKSSSAKRCSGGKSHNALPPTSGVWRTLSSISFTVSSHISASILYCANTRAVLADWVQAACWKRKYSSSECRQTPTPVPAGKSAIERSCSCAAGKAGSGRCSALSNAGCNSSSAATGYAWRGMLRVNAVKLVWRVTA